MRDRHPTPSPEVLRARLEENTRIRSGPPAWDDVEDAVREAPVMPHAPPPALPVPGRHAQPLRRAPRFALPGGVALGPAQVAVAAVLVAVALGVAGWWLLRGQAHEQAVAPLAVTTSAAGAPLTSGATPTTSGEPTAVGTASGEVVVHVDGEVQRPGVVVLPAGSRVADAVDAAGGALPDVDLAGVNLARPLVDGEQVLVGIDPPPGSSAGAPGSTAGAPGAAGGTPGAAGAVNLNTADLATLDTLPGVGPVTAQSILDWREANGGFTSVDELVEVDGIGEATLARIAPHVTV